MSFSGNWMPKRFGQGKRKTKPCPHCNSKYTFDFDGCCPDCRRLRVKATS